MYPNKERGKIALTHSAPPKRKNTLEIIKVQFVYRKTMYKNQLHFHRLTLNQWGEKLRKQSQLQYIKKQNKTKQKKT